MSVQLKNIEVTKRGYRQLADGRHVVSFEIHPSDDVVDLIRAPITTPFVMSLDQLDYDDTVNVEPIGVTPIPERRHPVAQEVAKYCGSPVFQKWLRVADADAAEREIKLRLHITNKRDLDYDTAKSKQWRDIVLRFEGDVAKQSYGG